VGALFNSSDSAASEPSGLFMSPTLSLSDAVLHGTTLGQTFTF
jgi:hypothetical protein